MLYPLSDTAGLEAVLTRRGKAHRSQTKPPVSSRQNRPKRPENLHFQTGFVVLKGRWVVGRSFSWLVHWGGLLRDRAGRPDVSATRIAFAAVLSGVEVLLNPIPTQAAAR
jgi:hypothetical protein